MKKVLKRIKLKILKNKKGDESGGNLALQAKVEVVMIVLVLIFFLAMGAVILDDHRLEEMSLAKDISLVLNILLPLPATNADIIYVTYEFSKIDMKKMNFEIDQDYTTVKYDPGKAILKESPGRLYIHFKPVIIDKFYYKLDNLEKIFLLRTKDKFSISKEPTNLNSIRYKCDAEASFSFSVEFLNQEQENMFPGFFDSITKSSSRQSGSGNYVILDIIEDDERITIYHPFDKPHLACSIYNKIISQLKDEPIHIKLIPSSSIKEFDRKYNQIAYIEVSKKNMDYVKGILKK